MEGDAARSARASAQQAQPTASKLEVSVALLMGGRQGAAMDRAARASKLMEAAQQQRRWVPAQGPQKHARGADYQEGWRRVVRKTCRVWWKHADGASTWE